MGFNSAFKGLRKRLRLNVWQNAVLSGGTEGTHEKLFRIGILQDDIRTHDLVNTKET
jgi:hypothetical protein